MDEDVLFGHKLVYEWVDEVAERVPVLYKYMHGTTIGWVKVASGDEAWASRTAKHYGLCQFNSEKGNK